MIAAIALICFKLIIFHIGYLANGKSVANLPLLNLDTTLNIFGRYMCHIILENSVGINFLPFQYPIIRRQTDQFQRICNTTDDVYFGKRNYTGSIPIETGNRKMRLDF